MFTTPPPKISVLVPVYNAAPFIGATIESVLAQSFTDFELLILDDASADNSAEIIAQYKDTRIKFFKNKTNLGISASRNRLVDLAQGEYIAVLDNDDICLPDRLKVQAEFLDSHPEIAFVGTWFELFAPRPVPLFKRLLVNMGWVWCHPLFPSWQDAEAGNVIMHPTSMYRRKVFADLGIQYNAVFTPAEDYDLVVQALAKDLKLANIPQVLLRYNLHGANASLVRKKQMKQADKLVKQKISSVLQRPLSYKPYWQVMLQKLRLKFMISKK